MNKQTIHLVNKYTDKNNTLCNLPVQGLKTRATAVAQRLSKYFCKDCRSIYNAQYAHCLTQIQSEKF